MTGLTLEIGIIFILEIIGVILLGFNVKKIIKEKENVNKELADLKKQSFTLEQKIKDNNTFIESQNENLSSIKKVFEEREKEQSEIFKQNCQRNKKDYDEEYLSLMKEYVESFQISAQEKQEELNKQFGEYIADIADEVILVGAKITKPIYEGLKNKKYNEKQIHVIDDVKLAFSLMEKLQGEETYVLLENDLPDIFNEKQEEFMKIKVGVIFGGETVEHEVSIISAIQAMNNLDEEKYDMGTKRRALHGSLSMRPHNGGAEGQ